MKKFFIYALFVFMLLIVFSGCNPAVPTNINEKSSNSSEKENSKELIIMPEAEDEPKLHKESAHFKFFCRKNDIKELDKLTSSLEKGFERISKDLDYKFNKKISVEIYKDSLELYNVTGLDCDATAKSGKIQMVRPSLMHAPPEIIIVHEFVHIVAQQLNPVLWKTSWLSEGLACYEAGGPPDEATRSIIVSGLIHSDSLPSWESINMMSYNTDDLYACSNTMIEYIVEKYGLDTLLKLIRNPEDIEKTLNISKKEYYNGWKSFVKEKYK